MRRIWFNLALVIDLASAPVCGTAQTPAWFGAGSQHCSVAQGTVDNRIFVCHVWNGNPQLFAAPLQLEIDHSAMKAFTIETGDPILEWHFWGDGRQLSVHYRAQNRRRAYVLYDTAAGNEVDTAEETDQHTPLPRWAKSQTQMEDEAVPEGEALTQQRTAWMGKLLRQLQTIHAGLKRQDLDVLLATEGGLSTRFERTYVSRECPLIKVDIRFKRPEDDPSMITEKPNDVIVFVSQPYLAWSISD